MITYRNNDILKVFLNGRRVGSIRPVAGGYSYFSYDLDEGGDVFLTVEEVKKSLEEA